MTSSRREVVDVSGNRKALLDAAQALMVEEGYGAVTTRRVAAKAGLKPQLVHYYFQSMDDLLLDVVRRATARTRDAFTRALTAPKPVREFWKISSDPDVTTLTIEMMALATRRTAIKAELAASLRRLRKIQTDALSNAFERSGITESLPLDALLLLVASVSRVMVMEEDLGVTVGHKNLRGLVERYIDEIEGPAD
jgi:TetR/AcrR family transcriptional regulator